MAWVKRNLGLVIGGVVALALLGVAVFYLMSNYQRDAEITTQLDETTDRFKTLLSRPLHPGGDGAKVNNIELLREENKRLQHFLEDVKGKFGKREIPTNISNRDFRALLDNTVHDLQRSADNFGITVPNKKDYWFTFAPQKTSVEFKNIEMLTHQLMDVKDLCEILYSSKIHDLVGIRRVPASSDDTSPTDFLTDKKASTNDYAIVTPYELKFQGFSSEIARVLDRLVGAKRCFIVRNIGVDKAPLDDGSSDPNAMAPSMMDSRYGNRYFNRFAPPTAPVAPRFQRPSNILVDENKLLVVLQVEAVRLKDPVASKPGKVKQVAQIPQ